MPYKTLVNTSTELLESLPYKIMDMYLYIVILVSSIAYFCWSLIKTDKVWQFVSAIIIFLPVFICGMATPLGGYEHKTVSATNTQVGKELVIQSEFPTLLSDKIVFINRKVEVERVIAKNVWRSVINTEYTIKTID